MFAQSPVFVPVIQIWDFNELRLISRLKDDNLQQVLHLIANSNDLGLLRLLSLMITLGSSENSKISLGGVCMMI